MEGGGPSAPGIDSLLLRAGEQGGGTGCAPGPVCVCVALFQSQESEVKIETKGGEGFPGNESERSELKVKTLSSFE